MAETSASSRLRFGVSAVLVLVALAILLSLGTWQVRRLFWKEALIAEIAARRQAAPLPLAAMEAVAAKGESLDYRPVAVEGRFRNDLESYFFTTLAGHTGYDVITPLELTDGRHVLINRGFVEYDNITPETRKQGQLTGIQRFTGLARDPITVKPGFMVPENDLAKHQFYWKDFNALKAVTGLPPERFVPFIIDAARVPDLPGGMPVGGTTLVDMPNNHLQYAITWYGLALALAGVALVSYVRRSNASRN